jgi:hypothetical protein
VSRITLRHATMRRLYELGQEQGWRVEQKGTELHWFSPDKTVSMVVTPMSPGDHDRGLANSLAQLRRAGLRIREEDTVKPAVEAEPEPEPPEAFVRELAGLIEQELEKRTRNLQDQVEALRNENADLRQRLADAETGFEEKAKAAALRAVEEMLAQRRVSR